MLQHQDQSPKGAPPSALQEAGIARSGPKFQVVNLSKPLEPQMLTQSIFNWDRAQTSGPKGQTALSGISVIWHGASQQVRGQAMQGAQRSHGAKYRQQLNEEITGLSHSIASDSL